MDSERDEKMDAVIAAIRDGHEDFPGSCPSEAALALYAASVVDGIGTFGFKIVKNDA